MDTFNRSGTNFASISGWNPNVYTIFSNPDSSLLLWGAFTGSTPTDTDVYATGCQLVNLTSGDIYVNVGTPGSPNFQVLGSTAAGIDQLTSDVVAGPGSGSQAATVVGFDGKPLKAVASADGQFYIFDTGNDWFNVQVMSQDATMDLNGKVTVNVQGNAMLAGFINTTASPQALSGPGAILLTSYQTLFTSTGTGDALTLGLTTKIGQLKKVSYVAEGSGSDTGVITPALGTFTTATLNAIGDYVTFIWTGIAGWAVIEFVGATIV